MATSKNMAAMKAPPKTKPPVYCDGSSSKNEISFELPHRGEDARVPADGGWSRGMSKALSDFRFSLVIVRQHRQYYSKERTGLNVLLYVVVLLITVIKYAEVFESSQQKLRTSKGRSWQARPKSVLRAFCTGIGSVIVKWVGGR